MAKCDCCGKTLSRCFMCGERFHKEDELMCIKSDVHDQCIHMHADRCDEYEYARAVGNSEALRFKD